jgi:hypothetical protein
VTTWRPWLPYAGWAALVGGVVLFAQPGFSYCAELHPRLCINALVTDATAPWNQGQGLLIVAALAAGFAVIAAERTLGRGTGIAFGLWATLVAVVLFLHGGQVQMCLGPLGVTPESCRVALGLPPETAWDRFANGPSLLIALLLTGWLVIVGARAGWRRRQRGGL